MLKPLFILASACILLLSCSKEQVVEGNVKKPIISDIENIASQTIKFEVSPMDAKVDSTNTTQQVNILIGEKSYQITTIQNWERIEKEAFEGLQIPASATDAIRETGNILNKILYAYKQTDDRVVVREGLISPNEDSITYKAILSLSSSDMSPDPDIDYMDIVGTYGYSDSEKSQILILSFNQRKMISAVLFNSEETELPTKDNMAVILSNAKPTALKNFFIKELERSFSSESYYGKYRKKDNQVIIIFDNMFDKDGKAIEFKKIL